MKDVDGIFPLDPAKTKRILLVDGGIIHPLIPQPLQFVLPDLLAKEGFEVTIDRPDIVPTPEISISCSTRWATSRCLCGAGYSSTGTGWAVEGSSRRCTGPGRNIPSVMISFGHPYHLYDAPRVPAYINAYSTMDSVQEAVVDCMLGRKPFLDARTR